MEPIRIERGAPAAADRVSFTFRLNPDVKERIERHAKHYRLSQQRLIDQLLTAALDQLDAQEHDEKKGDSG